MANEIGDLPKIKFLRIRPDSQFSWLYLPFDSGALWEQISESPGGEIWEVEVILLTEKEYEELPEFEGW